MTGVAPVTYDDLASGFNIADVVALLPSFDKIMGVTETELRQIIDYYRSEGRITRDTDDIIDEMKPWYDNYCFSEMCYGTEPSIYNTDMVMRYIKSLVVNGMSPAQMLDTNAQTDTQKLDYLVLADNLENRERRIEIIKEICAQGYTTGHIREQFPASRCGDEENFKSMLYYFGTLTFGGWERRGTKLIVPNKTMAELYLSYMMHVIKKQGCNLTNEYCQLVNAIDIAAVDGDWQPMAQAVGHCYQKYSDIRNAIRGEADVQGFVRGLLCLNSYYEIWPELGLGGGYCDILLSPKSTPHCPTRHSYLIEIKHMKADDTDTEARITQACQQLDRYAADNHLYSSELLHGTTLTKLYMVFQGKGLVAVGQWD